jgi:hypothetical protein
MLLDLKQLCTDSHRIAEEHGWLETERSFAACCDLIHSELSEALEDYRNNREVNQLFYELKLAAGGIAIIEHEHLVPEEDRVRLKPCGIPIELADAVIRIAQHCGSSGWDLADVVEKKDEQTRRLDWGDLEHALAWAHLFVSRAFLADQGVQQLSIPGGPATVTTNLALDELANALLVIDDFCTGPLGPKKPLINLFGVVMVKQTYNETRPHRHGGKKI